MSQCPILPYATPLCPSHIHLSVFSLQAGNILSTPTPTSTQSKIADSDRLELGLITVDSPSREMCTYMDVNEDTSAMLYRDEQPRDI